VLLASGIGVGVRVWLVGVRVGDTSGFPGGQPFVLNGELALDFVGRVAKLLEVEAEVLEGALAIVREDSGAGLVVLLLMALR